jgi:PTS system nitrogen regulatory IIA component
MRLSEPVDFDAPDGLPVDLVFGLIVPKQIDASHYADIESISVLAADLSLRARLRAATSSVELYDVWQAAQSTVTAKVRQSQSR